MNRPIVALPQPAEPEPTRPGPAGPTPNAPAAGSFSPTPTPTPTPTPASVGTPGGEADWLGTATAVPAVTATPVASTPVTSSPEAAFSATPVAVSAIPVQHTATPSTPSTPSSRPRFRIGLAQIVCWQLAVVAVAIAIGARIGPVGTTGTVVAALALVAVTAIRVRGTWLHQWMVIAVRFLLRQRQADLAGSGNAAVALLAPWLGGTNVDLVVVREKPLALLSHRTAVSAVLRLEPAAGVRDAMSGLHGALDEQPVDVEAQLLIHGNGRPDQEPRTWIAVAARRSVDLNTDDQLAMVVKNAVRRVQRHLERAGSDAVPVGDEEAVTTIVELSHASAGRGHVQERWSTWSAGPVSQVCVRLTGFTELAPSTADALVDTLLGTATGAAVTLSLGSRIASRTGAVIRHDPVLRIAAPSPGGLDVAVTVLTRLAGAYRVHPERLDGRHGLGMAASLPIARTLL